MWYACRQDTDEVIAECRTYKECSDEAFSFCPWGDSPEGEVAPYYLTTFEPTSCSICYGRGKVSDGYEEFACLACNGTGYTIRSTK